jgi:hypothetical protein
MLNANHSDGLIFPTFTKFLAFVRGEEEFALDSAGLEPGTISREVPHHQVSGLMVHMSGIVVVRKLPAHIYDHKFTN